MSLDVPEFPWFFPRMPTAILSTREEGQDISGWSINDLSPGRSYVAALAVEGHPGCLKYCQCPELGLLSQTRSCSASSYVFSTFTKKDSAHARESASPAYQRGDPNT